MTGISSSTGLVSGIDYSSLISQLMAVEGASVTNLTNRTTNLEKEETAITDLMALFLTSSFMIGNLNKADAFKVCDVNSNSNLLVATRTGTAVPGTYTFTPIRTATGQQTVAQGVVSDKTALGKEGTITIGRGWELANDVNLSEINGGDGLAKGYIRITDGSGTRTSIDLRQCITMNDVLDAINNNGEVDVWAELDGDKLVLTDLSEGDGKLKVQEVSNGKTAASLGILGEANDEGVLTGSAIYRLGETTSLSNLNDGNGITFTTNGPDISFRCKDGTSFNVDFYETSAGEDNETVIDKELNIGDLLNSINNAEGNDGRIVARISDDGKGITITDTTEAWIKAEASEPDDDDNITYTLPTGYEDDTLYEVDEDGFVVEIASGDRVLDPDATSTTISQHSKAGSTPILRTLGLIDGRYNSNEPVRFDGSITTRDLIGSLDSPLMASLNGGYGMSNATSGIISVQDRAGNVTSLLMSTDDIKTMQSGTLNEAIGLLNSKMENAYWVDKDGNEITYGDNVGIEIGLNELGTGLSVTDKSGGSSHNMVFQDVNRLVQELDEHGDPVLNDDGDPIWNTVNPNILGSLGLNVDTNTTSANGSSLHKQIISYNTSLAEMNGGNGITMSGGKFVITDSNGKVTTITLDEKKHQTLGDIINDINNNSSNNQGSGAAVLARINENGDGIEIVDTANGPGSLTIEDSVSSKSVSKAAADLGIVGKVTQADKTAAGGVMSINASTTYSVEVEATDSLDDIRKKINDLGGSFNASIVTDGSNTPYRLVINGTKTGEASAMNIDLSCLGLATEDVTEARDAILVYGDATTNSGITLTSSSNTFKNVVEGVDLTVAGYSSEPVTVSVEKSSVDVKASLQQFVTNYNSFREKLNEYTYYSPELEAGNILYNSTLAKDWDRAINKALLTEVSGITGINSLRSLGISIRSSVDDEEQNKQTGKLEFDESVFDEIWAKNSEGVQEFFFKEQTILDPSGERDEDGKLKTTTIKTGWAQKFMDAAEAFTDSDYGKATVALQTLDTKITKNYEQIEHLEARLAVKEKYYWNKFNNLETTLLSLNSDLSTVSTISSSWASNASSTGSYY